MESLDFPSVNVNKKLNIEDQAFDLSDHENDKEVTHSKKIKFGHFSTMGLLPDLLKGIIKLGFKQPTPIQRKTLPLSLQGLDVVGMARTGSGKTAAFLIPMFQRLRQHSVKMGCRAIILSPTRELALQTLKVANKMGKFLNLRTCLLVGGDSMQDQFAEIAKNPDIIVATPGRLMHQLKEIDYSLQSVEYIVFDEADRLFEMGFAEQLKEILNQLPAERQTLLFSATLPSMLIEFARAGLRDPQVVRLDTEIKLSDQLQNHFFFCREDEKMGLLLYLLRVVIGPREQTIIFVSTRHHVDFLNEVLSRAGYSVTYVYGSMDQAARKIHVAKFSHRKANLMLVTDVAARGIDIPLLDNVINYDFPAKPKLFVHRVGRVARMGRSGSSYSFLSSEETAYLLDLQKFLNKPLSMICDQDHFQTDTIYYGALPQDILDQENESVRKFWVGSGDLESLKQSTINAYKLHVSLRPKPSSNSIKAAKDFSTNLKIHPIIMKTLPKKELEQTLFVNSLKSFRPPATIFEILDRPGTKDTKTTSAEMMKKKRSSHQGWIEPKKKLKAEVQQQDDMEETIPEFPQAPTISKPKFRDPQFYMDFLPENYSNEQEYGISDIHQSNLAFDLVGEDQEEMRQKKLVSKWDKRKKKFVKVKFGEDPNSKEFRKKNEAGVKIGKDSLKKRGEIYAEWKQKNQLSIPRHGESESVVNIERFQEHSKFMKDYAARRSKDAPTKIREELKTPQQIYKNQREKRKKQLLSMPKSKKRDDLLEKFNAKYKKKKQQQQQSKPSKNDQPKKFSSKLNKSQRKSIIKKRNQK